MPNGVPIRKSVPLTIFSNDWPIKANPKQSETLPPNPKAAFFIQFFPCSAASGPIRKPCHPIRKSLLRMVFSKSRCFGANPKSLPPNPKVAVSLQGRSESLATNSERRCFVCCFPSPGAIGAHPKGLPPNPKVVLLQQSCSESTAAPSRATSRSCLTSLPQGGRVSLSRTC